MAHVVFVAARSPPADLDPRRARAYSDALAARFAGSLLAAPAPAVRFTAACGCASLSQLGLNTGSGRIGQHGARGSAARCWASGAPVHGSAPADMADEGDRHAAWVGSRSEPWGSSVDAEERNSGAAPARADSGPHVSWFMLPEAPSHGMEACVHSLEVRCSKAAPVSEVYTQPGPP